MTKANAALTLARLHVGHHFFPVRLEEVECLLVSVGLTGLCRRISGAASAARVEDARLRRVNG
jgi:hypothetical protein